MPRKKSHATGTLTNEQDANRTIKASQETGPMTDDTQAREGANISRVDMPRPKPTRSVGCWNVWNLYPAGKLNMRRSVEKEMREFGWTLSQVQRWASNRQHFSSLVTALCATEHEED